MVEGFLQLAVLKITDTLLAMLRRQGRAGWLLRKRGWGWARKQEQPEKLGTYLHRGHSIPPLGDTDKVRLKSNFDRPSLKCDCACRFLSCKSNFDIALERRQHLRRFARAFAQSQTQPSVA